MASLTSSPNILGRNNFNFKQVVAGNRLNGKSPSSFSSSKLPDSKIWIEHYDLTNTDTQS